MLFFLYTVLKLFEILVVLLLLCSDDFDELFDNLEPDIVTFRFVLHLGQKLLILKVKKNFAPVDSIFGSKERGEKRFFILRKIVLSQFKIKHFLSPYTRVWK